MDEPAIDIQAAQTRIPCPGCGYVRSNSDQNPEWQCPKCLRAYVKLAHTVESNVPETEPVEAPEREAGVEAVILGVLRRIGDLKPHLDQFRQRVSNRTAASAVAVIAIAVVAYPRFFSEDSALLSRWEQYEEPVRSGLHPVYELLTPFTRSIVSEEDWMKRYQASDPRCSDQIIKVTMRNDTAILSIDSVTESGAICLRYAQSWAKIDGKWYRAWAEDKQAEANRGSVEKKVAETTKTLPDLTASNTPSLLSTVLIESAETTWEVQKDVLGDKYIYRPRTAVQIRNLGHPISELRMMARFVSIGDDGIRELFDEDESTVVSSSDIAFASGERRTILFESGKGYGIDPADISPVSVPGYKALASKSEVELYMKREYGDTWEEIPLR